MINRQSVNCIIDKNKLKFTGEEIPKDSRLSKSEYKTIRIQFNNRKKRLESRKFKT